MDLYLDLNKGRKSVGRMDASTSKSRESKLAEALSVENFLGDLTSKTVVSKSERVLDEFVAEENLDIVKGFSNDTVESLSEKVHDAWRELAPKDHPNQVPYSDLSKTDKDKDKQTVKAVLKQLSAMGLLADKSSVVKAALYHKDLIKADNAHLPDGAERCAYVPDTNYGVVYIPVNRLRQVYQTDEALNPAKVNENRRKMRAGIPLSPVEIGYNYDVHDGHHRWKGSWDEGYTHVPCKVVGTDPSKVKAARKRYMEVWKSQTSDIALVLDIDLAKAVLHKGKLIKRQVMVKGKGGKTFYRMQWVDPNDKNPGIQGPKGGKDESTYHHHDHEVKNLERAQSNKFPVVHHPTKDLKVGHGDQNYKPDHELVRQAEQAYHRGEKLAPVRINHKGEVVMNAHLVEMAKKLGLSHVPSLVMGNTTEKKKLEDKLKDEVMVEAKDEDGKTTLAPAAVVSQNGGSVGDHPDVSHFKNFTTKKYTKQHLMDEARKQGIQWVEHTKAGESLENHPAIMWKNAHMAIVDHIRKGGTFVVEHNERDVDKRMKQEGWDSIHKHFLKLVEKHGSRESLMEWAKNHGISWKEKSDPSINWMYAATAIKKELAKGHMVDGVRTRQKEAMNEANTVVTDQIKDTVKEYGQKYGKKAVMDRADELGILFDRFDKNGQPYAETSPKLWMNASMAVQKYIAQGNNFSIGEDNVDETGISSRVGDYGDDIKLTNLQSGAVDLGKRNSQKFELKAKKWALDALKADFGDGVDHQEMYEQFMHNARNAKLMVHFDPFEELPSGVSLLEQWSSDGHVQNNWLAGSVTDPEAMEINERELFDTDFDDASHRERPNYGTLDLLNQGLDSSPYGEVALVLKHDVKKRATGVHTDSGNLAYETNGKLTRSLEDPHHLLVDKWQTRWSKVAGPDAKRKRMMEAIMGGHRTGADGDYIEAHVHGGIDLRRDIDHILVPAEWKTDSDREYHHEALQSFSKLMGISLKYEDGTSDEGIVSGK